MEKLFENTTNFGYYHQKCKKFDDLKYGMGQLK